MSFVEYIKCDGVNCGRVTPCEGSVWAEGWAVLTHVNHELHLCPDCAKKALEAVGLE